MTSAIEDFTEFKFSTAKVAPSRRFALWHEVFGRAVSRRKLAMLSGGGSCHVDMRVRNLAPRGEGVSVQRMTLSGGVSAERTTELLSDGNDNIVLHVHTAGRRFVSQIGHEASLAPRCGIFTSNADPSLILLPERARFACVGLPRKLMLALAPGIEDALMRLLPDSALLRLLMRYLDILDDEDALKTPDLRRAAATHIHDLCALAVGATRDAAEVAQGRGLRAARLRAIKNDIARNLDAGDLSAASLALRQGVTPRYIHKLFEDEGMTLSKFVLGQRLARVHRMLGDPRHAPLTIGAIAYGAGFGDLSTFNREFRRCFGATPSDVRAANR